MMDKAMEEGGQSIEKEREQFMTSYQHSKTIRQLRKQNTKKSSMISLDNIQSSQYNMNADLSPNMMSPANLEGALGTNESHILITQGSKE